MIPRAPASWPSVRLGSTAARDVGATNGVRPTVGEVIVQLDGTTVTTVAGSTELSTAKVIGTGQDRRRQPNQDVVFNRLGLGDSLLHRLINPSIAYFLIVVGLALIVFEFYTASIGLAGLVGAICLIGAFVGFSHLPVHWWALGLLFFSMFGFAVDVQAGGLAVWTVIGTVSLVTGSWFLYGGASQLRPAWWVFLVVIAGAMLFMLGGMTAMIRSRFSTPTVGREGMIGEDGTAEVAVDPDGVVLIRGARWRARTNRATPIQAGDPVKVVAVEGLVLEVEPPEGGAQDYRERARNRKAKRTDLIRPCESRADRSRFRAARHSEGGGGSVTVQTLNSWRTRAACRGPETALFFPPSNTERRDDRDLRESRAKAICRQCPVRSECLDHTLPRRGVPRDLGRTQRARTPRDARGELRLIARLGSEPWPGDPHVAATAGEAFTVELLEQRDHVLP